MKNIGYYNGEYGPIEEMKIPMNDRVHYFGDGIYDATSCGNHVIYLIDEHIERFYNNAALVGMEVPCTREELQHILQEMVDKVEGDLLFVYWQLTRGTAPRKHAFPDVKANLWVTVTPLTFRNPKERTSLTTMEDCRYLYCNIKTLNLMPSVLAAEKAERENCYETVFHRGDQVTECAHSNVSILKNGRLKTHPNDQYILPGLAKKHLLRACEALGIPVDEEAFTLAELRDADEILTSSSSNFCLAAERLEGKKAGGRAPELVEALQDYLMKEFRDYCGIRES